MTGRELISASLRLIGAIAPGETLAASEATDGLAALNRMIGTWSNEKLLINAITAETALTLTPGDGTITMGTAGDFTTRPQSIDAAMIRDSSTDNPVRLLTLAEYAAIPNKNVQSTYPTSLYDDGGYPLRTLTLYPVPSAAMQLVLYTFRAITSIATIDTSVSLPPGYEDALTYNLAMRLAPEYGKSTPSEVGMIAADSKAAIKRANHRPAYLSVDPALLTRSRFNIYTGGG